MQPKKRFATVVVVGAGPAGTAAAHTLAKSGKDVLIIDKATFPREKLCGGLLTGRTKRVYHEIFENGWEDALEHTTHGAGIYEKERLLQELNNYSSFHQSKRIHFDHYLLQLAEKQGVQTHLGDTLLDIDFKSRVLTMKSGLEIGYTYLIGADGVNSAVAKALFGESFNKKDIGFALEVELPKGHGNWSYKYPSLHFDVVNWGYGWIFPKADTDTFGIAGIHSKNPDMKARFQQFHEDIYGEPFEGKIKGHYIPFGGYKRTPGDGEDVLLVGDAAGLVDPITGEGIAFALESGQEAGKAVIASLEDGRGAYDHYMVGYARLAEDIQIGKELAQLLYPSKLNAIFRRVLPKANFLMRAHMDLMNEKISYRDFKKYVLKAMLRNLGKLVVNYLNVSTRKSRELV